MDFSGSGSGIVMDNLTTNASFKFCAERLLSSPLPSSPLSTDVARVFQFLYLFTCLLLGMSLNLLPIVLVARFKKLQSLSSVIGLQIMALNVIRTAVETIPSLISIAAGGWVFGPHACVVHGYLRIICLDMRRSLMIALCTDRFCLVFWTFQYPNYRKKIALALSLLAWIFIPVYTTLALPGLGDCFGISSEFSCGISYMCSQSCAIVGLFNFIVVSIPSHAIPLVLYISLYLKGRQMREIMATDGFAHQLDNRERKANVTFFLLFLSLFLFSIPSVTVLVLGRLLFRYTTPTPEAQVMFGIMIHIALFLVVVDPVVVLRNKDFREVLAEVKERLLKKT